MPRRIPPINKGQTITAERLNDYGEGINKLNDLVFNLPRAIDDPGEAQAEGETEDPSVYVESSRTTSLVQVFDDEGTNYAEVDRIETITLVNGDGEELKLQFNN